MTEHFGGSTPDPEMPVSLDDWESATDIGQSPTGDELRQFFTFSRLPLSYQREIDAYFYVEQGKTTNEQRDCKEDVALLRRYYQLVRQNPTLHDKHTVMKLVARSPVYADTLFPLFARLPELAEPYIRYAPQANAGEQDPSLPYGESRISGTLDQKQIETFLRENAALAARIIDAHQLKRSNDPDYRLDAYEQQLATAYDGQVAFWAGVSTHRNTSDWLRVRVTPGRPHQAAGRSDQADSDFETFVLEVNCDTGLVSSESRNPHERQKLGYLLLPNNGGIAERALLAALGESSPSEEKLEELVEPYLERQGIL